MVGVVLVGRQACGKGAAVVSMKLDPLSSGELFGLVCQCDNMHGCMDHHGHVCFIRLGTSSERGGGWASANNWLCTKVLHGHRMHSMNYLQCN